MPTGLLQDLRRAARSSRGAPVHALALLAVALTAAARPAWRAAHVDPAAALRDE